MTQTPPPTAISDERAELIAKMGEFVTHRSHSGYSVLGDYAAECALKAIEQAGFALSRRCLDTADEEGPVAWRWNWGAGGRWFYDEERPNDQNAKSPYFGKLTTVEPLFASRTRNTEVVVKALEWSDWAQGGFISRANDLLEYSIAKGNLHWRLYVGKHQYIGAFDSAEAAKAAAQADFDQRIRSALAEPVFISRAFDPMTAHLFASPPSPVEVTDAVAYINAQGGVMLTRAGEAWFKSISPSLARFGSPAAELFANPVTPSITDAQVERAARAIASTAYDGIYFTTRSREQYVDAEWRNHETDARTALTAALDQHGKEG